MGKKKIICIATLDTKGPEIQYVKDIIQARGHRAVIVDCGSLGEPAVLPDIPREDVLKAARSSREEVMGAGSAGKASEIMITGLRKIIRGLYESKDLDGVIAIGGGTGSNVASAAMRDLPVGTPKLLVSTKVGQAGAQGYVGTKDVTIMPSVADLEGLNRLTKRILANAAGAICGMVETQDMESITHSEHPLVVMSMVGTTTQCGLRVKSALEKVGYEVVIFHTVGVGGRALEEFVRSEAVKGVIELGISEVGNDLFGGLAAAGPDRLEEAGIRGIPQIVTPGHSGYIQFLALSTIPVQYRQRNIIIHNPQATAVVLNVDEMIALAGVIASKLNRATGPTRVLIPTLGFSAWDKEGEKYYDPERNRVFIEHLEKGLDRHIRVRKIEAHINDDRFGDAIVKEFMESMSSM
jgi:uncharacterized protein (UPF0261 family)